MFYKPFKRQENKITRMRAATNTILLTERLSRKACKPVINWPWY